MEFADSARIRIKTHFLCKYIAMYFMSSLDKQDMRIKKNITACEAASCAFYNSFKGPVYLLGAEMEYRIVLFVLL